MNKIQINFSDAIPLTGRISINANDRNGLELFIGDSIKDDNDEIHVIGYRYGDVSLIPPYGMHTMQIKDYSRYEKINQMTAIMGKYLIVGYDNEQFFNENSEVLGTINITRTIPQ